MAIKKNQRDFEAARMKQALLFEQSKYVDQWLEGWGVRRRPSLKLVERSSFEAAYVAAFPARAVELSLGAKIPWLSDAFVADLIGRPRYGDRWTEPLSPHEEGLLKRGDCLGKIDDDISGLLKVDSPTRLRGQSSRGRKRDHRDRVAAALQSLYPNGLPDQNKVSALQAKLKGIGVTTSPDTIRRVLGRRK